jgi:hypothetical protein
MKELMNKVIEAQTAAEAALITRRMGPESRSLQHSLRVPQGAPDEGC